MTMFDQSVWTGLHAVWTGFVVLFKLFVLFVLLSWLLSDWWERRKWRRLEEQEALEMEKELSGKEQDQS